MRISILRNSEEFHNFTINYIFINLSLTKKEKNTELKLKEAISFIFSFMSHMYICLNFILPHHGTSYIIGLYSKAYTICTFTFDYK